MSPNAQPTVLEIPLDAHDREERHAVLAHMKALFSSSNDDVRTTYDRFVAGTPLAANVSFEVVTTPGLRGEWCIPRGAPNGTALLYLHGGGYTNGSAHAFRGMASQLASRAGLRTFVLDYPLTPESPFPAAYEMAIATLGWLSQRGVGSLSVAGDSAGGGLALATVAGAVRGAPAPRIVGCLTFSAWVDMTLKGSTIDFADPVLVTGGLQRYARMYAGDHARLDPRASPLFDIPFRMPPLLLQVGTEEQLLDDSHRYAHAAAAAGNDVELDVFDGMHHVFQLGIAHLHAAREALDRAGAFLRRAHGRT
ncbi:Esterase/lipase [Labilithrix luteola]|uniref:Esterase/lipase n=1 Tax=Labilithrix luteola TaxID=1391654 RepID=A0A0K1Q3S2_9BACT|nr:alpha/beta hydrolase fold domain-containing protein [Labilithrix luteola]AKV00379.1 Esterase/lipase [Labilithrix luteola]